MDVSNASLYEGGTAVSEAVFMAMRCTKRHSRIVVLGSVSVVYALDVSDSIGDASVDEALEFVAYPTRFDAEDTTELLAQAGRLDTLLVPTGGGGLLSGAAVAVRHLHAAPGQHALEHGIDARRWHRAPRAHQPEDTGDPREKTRQCERSPDRSK